MPSLVLSDDVVSFTNHEVVLDLKHVLARLASNLSIDFRDIEFDSFVFKFLIRNRFDHNLCVKDFMVGYYDATLLGSFNLRFNAVLV